MTQRNNTPIHMDQFNHVLAHAYMNGRVERVVVDHPADYIHFYSEGVLIGSTKWHHHAQISNNWLAMYPLPQDKQ